ncbi:MAG TPA: hypothetical protein VIF14_11000 [Alphaproteobacteria bacterium]|jgi:hypothetical protein
MTPRAARLAALAAILALAACASPPPGEGGVPYLVTAARVIGPEALYVEAEAVHRSRFHRLERMVLVDPAGAEHAAIDVRADVVRTGYPGYPFGSVGVGAVSGGRTSVGVGVGFPLFADDTYGTVFRMRATFRVPDARAYRRDPGAWRIRLHLARKTEPPVVVDRPAPLPGG